MNKNLIFPLIISLAVVMAAQAAPITVGRQKTINIAVEGATAAFPLDSQYVDAWAQNGILTIVGKNVGSDTVVVITPSGTQTFEVVVPQSPPSYPPGFVKPLPATASSENGNYEVRYASDTGQLQNNLDLFHQTGQRSVRFHLVGTTFLPGTVSRLASSDGPAAVNFPSAFYQIKDANREITLLDQLMTNSPLTVNGSVVRGFHLQQGPWLFHAGFTSIATFEGYFLPAQREGVIGIGYRRPLGAHGTLTRNLYFFPNQHGTNSRRGLVVSLLYEYTPNDRLHLLTELGVSHGVGFSSQLDYARLNETIRANLRYEPKNFASLGVNSLHGFFSDFSWTRAINAKLTSDAFVSANRYMLPDNQQTNLTGRVAADYKFLAHGTLSGGVGYGSFSSSTGSALSIKSLNLPVGVSFNSRHFGSSFQYQYSRNFGRDLGGSQIRQSIHAGWKHLQISGYVNRQTQAPTLSYIFSQTTGLEQTLERLGLAATTPEEISALLQKNATLFALGYLQGATVNISPIRYQTGGSLSLSAGGRWHPQLNLDFLYSNTRALNGSFQNAIPTMTYSQKLSAYFDLFLSYSLFRTKLPGKPSEITPLFTISLRRQFFRVPRHLMFAERRGTISGSVFRDENAKGVFESGMPAISGVEVVLDGTRRTHTDRYGLYSFSNVSYESHSVEAIYHSEKPYFFTTASPVSASANDIVNFGIGVVLAQLSGHVRNDAGKGVSGVGIVISGENQRFSAQTDSEGKFSVRGLQGGEYEVSVNGDSVPPGYSLYDLNNQTIVLRSGNPADTQFTIRAFRNISGQIRMYDRASGQFVSVPGVKVDLRELSKTSVADSKGLFLFRDLPAGTYTVSVIYQDREFTQRVTVEAEPGTSNVEMNLGAINKEMRSPVDSETARVQPQSE